jgi:trk system potassium uptake protein TrkA
MRVGIAGAGAVGLYIANDLRSAGHDVQIIEQSEAVRARAEVEPGIEWHVADACEVSSLREAGLERCDVVVAATGDDEDNLVISLLAKTEFAVPRVIARVNHPKNEWLFNENWGVDLSVSTPHLITALVEEAVTVGRLVRILQFEGGQARLVEVTLADDSPVVDRAIQDIDIPRDATFVAIVRGEHVVMPRGDTIFEAGDEVLAMVTPDSEDEVRTILTGASAHAGASEPESRSVSSGTPPNQGSNV